MRMNITKDLKVRDNGLWKNTTSKREKNSNGGTRMSTRGQGGSKRERHEKEAYRKPL
jgi:hypothetical protein